MTEVDPYEIDYDTYDNESEVDYFEFSPNLEDLTSFAEEEDDYYSMDADPLGYDDIFSDMDFSDYSGKYKPNMRRAIRKVRNKRHSVRRRRRPVPVKRRRFEHDHPHKHPSSEHGKAHKDFEKVLVPSNRKVIIEGVNNFILDHSQKSDFVKNMGYYQGRKLKELVITFNNNSALDFDIELFNPSFPLDYLQSTSLNINDKVQIAGGGFVSYTDILFNMLANPARLYHAKFTLAGPNMINQINQPLILGNKSIEGKKKVSPFQMQLNIDIDQQQNNLIYFDVEQTLGRPFIPDGMDIITYKVLAGMTVTFGFYYSQVSLKKFFYKEAYCNKGLL